MHADSVQLSGDMDENSFVETYGGVYEHSPWVAQQAFGAGIESLEPEWLATAFARQVDAADVDRKLALIRAHPDLAGRAAVRGELTAASSAEQAGAGIDQCSTEEFARFEAFNREYRARFGFPFIMAVKGSNRHAILDAFAARVGNDYATEFAMAIAEIHKIARFRLDEIGRPTPACEE